MITIKNQNGLVIGQASSIGTVIDGSLLIEQSSGPIPDPTAFTQINMPFGRLVAYPTKLNPTTPPGLLCIWWVVDALVAAVDVFDNGTVFPNPKGPATHTYVYRAAGQPIPGAGTGYIFWAVTPAGQHDFKFVAYDDNGGVINTTLKSVFVNAE